MSRRGFTLIEMLLVLVVILSLAAVSWPVIDGVLADYQLKRAAETVGTVLGSVRVRAIDAGCAYQFRFEPAGRRWIAVPYDRDDLSGATDDASAAGVSSRSLSGEIAESLWFEPVEPALTGERLDRSVLASLPDSSALTNVVWSSPVVFYANGTADAASFDVCDVKGQAFRMSVRDLTGSVSIDRAASRAPARDAKEKR